MVSDRLRTDEKDLDFIRKLVLDTIQGRPGASLANVSRAIGRGQSYLSDYIWYGKPDELPERTRFALAQHLELLETELRPTGLAKPDTGYDRPPPTAPQEAPITPYEARDLMVDLIESLDRLHREERLALSLRELGLAAWDMHGEIMATGGDLRAGLERTLRARRRHIRVERAAWLTRKSTARTTETGISDDPAG